MREIRPPYQKHFRFVTADVLRSLGLEDLPLPAPPVQAQPKSKRKLVVTDAKLDAAKEPAPITAFFEKPAADLTAAWSKHIDDDTGCPYYYNAVTQESVWVAPAGFVDKS